MRRFALLLFLVVCSLGQFPARGEVAPPPPPERERIVAVVATDMPPTFYRDPVSGKPVGFAIDVLDEVARRAGLEVTYVYGKPWDEMQQMVLAGEADLNPSLIINDARRQQFLFTDPVETMPINYIVRASDSSTTGPRPGMRVGAIRGSTAESHFKARRDLKLSSYESMHQLLMELMAGRLDLVMTATPNIRKLASDAGLEDHIRVIDPPVLEGKRAMALRPGAVALQQRLNRAIDEFLQTPEYRGLYNKWWGKPQPYWTAQRVALAMGLMLLWVAALLIAWRYISNARLNRRLKAEVREREEANQKLQQAMALSRELAESARRANLAKSEFLANMSHELRTPLNGVLGMLQLLEACQPTPEQSDYIARASRSGWSLLTLLDDILDLSRLEAGLLQLTPGRIDLTLLTESISTLFAVQAQQKGLQLQVTHDPQLPQTVRGDGKRLRQIILNLLGNAVKFTATGTVRLQLIGGQGGEGRVALRLVVADSGIGIAPEQLQQMFEPFVQGDSSYCKHFQGAGLGLTIVKRLVEAMSGSLQIESRPGEGTTVTIDLEFETCVDEPSEAVGPAAVLPAVPQGLRVLLAEDNEENRQLLCLLLRRAGHEVTAVADGRQALERLAAAPYDLVLMDIQMPVMDGMEALQAIRAGSAGVRNPAIPVVALTAYAMAGDREKFLAAGMNDYLAKPVRMRRLQEVLQRYAGSPAPV